jgi:hypothetical protein
MNMKKLLALLMAVTLSAFPFAVYGVDPGSQALKPPPVSQELVSEGDFAFQLATTLKLGTPATEAQAEDMLTSVGIAPKNGWIADYPMTPIVVGEVQNAVIAATASKKLSMEKDDALQAFQALASDFSLAVSPATSQYAEAQPLAASDYVEPPVVENYYAEEGPPVVTYYTPPWDYYYLYAWVPYPFWCTGFYFPGFYVLNDFDVVVGNFHPHGHHFHHGHDFDHRITNHFMDPRTHQAKRVDPTMRTRGSSVPATRTAAFSSPQARREAASIVKRSAEVARSRRPTAMTDRSFPGGPASRAVNGRTFNSGNSGSPRSFQGPSTGQGRTFSTSARTFNSPSQGFGRSFSPPSRSSSSPPMTSHNFSGGFQDGGFGGFHSGTAFSGGGGFHGGGHR